ncbi:MAG: hypothetical protein MUC50_02575 [Myxococcota bacterium]|jgi:hypothetical protein|nr:hypothetical protein [Myxococcota bacterium]
MLRAIKTFLRDPAPTSRFADVVPGLNVVEGLVRVEEPLRSPVRGQNCAAFFYRSFLIITGQRSPQPAIHKIKQAEGYAPFTLEMDTGRIKVMPARAPEFGHAEHAALAKQYGSSFRGVEELVLPGAKVRVRGRVKRMGEELVLSLKDLEVIEKQTVAAGVVGDRKQRRSKKSSS